MLASLVSSCVRQISGAALLARPLWREMSSSSAETAGRREHFAKLAGGSRMMVREDVLDLLRSHGFNVRAEDVRPQLSLSSNKHAAAWWLSLESAAELQRVQMLSQAYMAGGRIKVSPHTKEEFESSRDDELDPSMGRYVFVSNIPEQASQSDVHRAVRAYSLLGSRSRSRGQVAIVKFQSQEEAQRCVRQRNGYKWDVQSERDEPLRPISDENNIRSTSNALESLSSAIASVIGGIKEKVAIGVDEQTLADHEVNLAALESFVSGLEGSLQKIDTYLKQERRSLAKADKFVDGCLQQKALLEHMRTHLPAHLPNAPSARGPSLAEAAGPQWPAYTPVAFQMPSHLIVPGSPSSQAPSQTQSPATTRALQQQAANLLRQSQAQSASLAALTDAPAAERRERRRAPRNFITQDELASCSSYLLGRLTLDKVNSALDEVAGLAERNAKVMASLRGSGPSVSLQPAERERAFDLLHNLAKHPDVKGRFWFCEHDLAQGVCIKRDKTGKSILQILRHCKRLSEVRGRVQGQQELAFVLSA